MTESRKPPSTNKKRAGKPAKNAGKPTSATRAKKSAPRQSETPTSRTSTRGSNRLSAKPPARSARSGAKASLERSPDSSASRAPGKPSLRGGDKPPGRASGKPSTRKPEDTSSRPDNRSSGHTNRKPLGKPGTRNASGPSSERPVRPSTGKPTARFDAPSPSRPPAMGGPKAEPIRLNRYLAQSTGLARRKADEAIGEGRVKVNGKPGKTGQVIIPGKDKISLDGKPVEHKRRFTTIRFFKPKGVITTRTDPEGRKTIYDCLPEKYHNLDPIGRLDRESVGLLLLTDDGTLLHELSHPSFGHAKRYKVTVDKPLTHPILQELEKGITLMPEDVVAQCQISQVETPFTVVVQLTTGYNRQIRRCFEHVGYTVTQLKRLSFGPITLDKLAMGEFKELTLTEHQRLKRVRPETPGKKPSKSKSYDNKGIKDSGKSTDKSSRPKSSVAKRSSSSPLASPPKRNNAQQKKSRPVKPSN